VAQISDEEVRVLRDLLGDSSEERLDALFCSTTKEELRDRLGSDAAKFTLEHMTLIYRIGPHWRERFEALAKSDPSAS
jgi:hypothetical protein